MPSTRAAPTTAAPNAPAFAVQVAAFDTRAGAEEDAARLRARGVDAYVEAQGPNADRAPFRVKVGHFPTRAAADAERRTLAGRGTKGFVTDVATTQPPAAPAAAPTTVASAPSAEPADTTAPRPRRARRNVANPAARCRVVDFTDNPPTARVQSLSDGAGHYVTYVGGGVVAHCVGVGNTLRADSTEYYQTAGLLVLVGHVSYDEPERARLTADRLTYYTNDERLVAEGSVNVTLPTGTTMTGPNAEYLREAPPIRTESRLTAVGRPVVHVVGTRGVNAEPARPRTDRDTSTTTIIANTVIDQADSVVYASGQVEITRTDVVATSDSAMFDQDTERARLLRDARIRGTRGRSFTMTGSIVDLFTRERALSRVVAQREAQVVSDSLTLKSDTVDLRLDAGVLQRAYAWGPSRANAIAPDRDVIADSIEAYLPRQRVREIHALRKAVARTVPDTARFRSNERDVLRGDTIVARFDSVAAARDTTKNPPVRQLVAAGNASSLFQLASREGREGRPAVNYVRGRVITVSLDSGQVQEVMVIGKSNGVYLEPSDSTAVADSTRPAARRATPTPRSGGAVRIPRRRGPMPDDDEGAPSAPPPLRGSRE